MASEITDRISGIISKLSPRGKFSRRVAIESIALGLFGPISDDDRAVTVNGKLFSDEELVHLDTMFGGEVPNGQYWLDPHTITWRTNGTNASLDPSNANHGELHWADAGQNRRGVFGDYISDGN